jgi:hypothetical protein
MQYGGCMGGRGALDLASDAAKDAKRKAKNEAINPSYIVDEFKWVRKVSDRRLKNYIDRVEHLMNSYKGDPQDRNLISVAKYSQMALKERGIIYGQYNHRVVVYGKNWVHPSMRRIDGR